MPGFFGSGQAIARDDATGEYFVADGNGGITRLDPVTGASTPILTGVAFGSGPQAMAIVYVAGVRHFVVAATAALIDVDASGATRTLRARTPSTSQFMFQVPGVAARSGWAFYSEGNPASPIVYRFNLALASPVAEPLSVAPGGELSLDSRKPVSAFQFGDPHGLAIAIDGGLYVADRRRNAVYEILPNAAGEIAPDSRIVRVVGDGVGRQVLPVGLKEVGRRFGIAQPTLVSTAGDGRLWIVNPFGVALFDPLSTEASWRVFDANLPEGSLSYPLVGGANVTAAATPTGLVFHDGHTLAALDVADFVSQDDPTRTATFDLNGATLLDTTAETIEAYDTRGRLLERRKRSGELVLAVSYVDPTSEAIDRITDPKGGVTQFSYTGGKLASITDAAGHVTRLTVDGRGDLTQIVKPDLETWTFAYSGHRMTSKTSPREDVTSYTYDANGALETSTKSTGGVFALASAYFQPPQRDSATGFTVHGGSYTDAHGVTHTFVLDPKGYIDTDTFTADGVAYARKFVKVPVIGQGGNVYVQPRNTLQRISYVLLNGLIVEEPQLFDDKGRVVIVGDDAPNALKAFSFDSNGYLTRRLENPTQVETILERDALGRVIHEYDRTRTLLTPTGRETFNTWRVDGLPDTMTEHGVTTTYIYDAMGNVANTSDTLGRTNTFTRDRAGNVLTFNDGATTVTSGYDANNRLTSTTDALGNTTTYGYTLAGCGCSQDDLVTSIHTPDLPADKAWGFSYGAEGRLAQATDPDGRAESYEYETTGELKKVVDRLLRSTTVGHDQLGRVTALIDALGRAHARSYPVPSSSGFTGPKLFAGSAGATAPSTDVVAALASGDYQIGENTHDLRTIPFAAPGSRGYPQKTLYRDATFALTWDLQTDLAGRLTQRVDHTTGGGLFFQQFVYDARNASPLVGLFNTTVSGGIRSGRLDHNADFDLDNALGIAGGFQPEADYFFTRDPGGRLSGVTRSYPLVGPAFAAPASTYTYFANGKLKQRIDVDGQHDYAYDARGLLLSISSTEGVYTFEYDAVGRNTRLVFPDSHVRVQHYDNEGRTTSRCYTYADASKTRCYTADYDAAGNPTRMTDPEGTEVIEYDALDRLARATRSSAGQPDVVEDYAYNALGALSLNAGVALDMQRPRLDNPAVLADSAVPRTFNGQPVVLDGAGRITGLDGMTLTYNALSQLTGVQAAGQSEVYYVDALSRRWGRTANGQTEIYVFDELAGTDVVGVIDTTGAAKETYLFDGVDHPLRLRRGSFVWFYEMDLAGNVRRLRDSSGGDLGGYRYTAFGRAYAADTTTPPPSVAQPLRWKARWQSDLTALYDVRARNWSPEMALVLSIVACIVDRLRSRGAA